MSSSFPPKAFLALFLIVLLLAGCTVKEDRSECPMPLRVVPGLRATDVPVRYHLESEEETVWSDVFMCNADSSVSIEVPRRLLESFASYSSKEDYYDESGNFLIPSGHECPEIWTHSAMLDATVPVVSDTVDLYRSRACITFVVSGAGKARTMALLGKVRGVNKDGSPAIGEFHCLAGETGRKDNSGRWTVGVPRQYDDSLSLEIESSGVLRIFPVGRFLDDSGYDWTARSLEDVTIEIDYSDYHVRVRTEAWEHTLSFDIRF